MEHPENSPQLNSLISEVENTDTCEVWCKSCQAFRVANAAFAKYLQGEIETCSKCWGK